MKYFTILLLSLFIFLGCQRKSLKELNPFESIDVENLSITTVNSDSLIQSGHILEFQNLQGNILGSNSEIIQVNDHGIFIMDKWSNKKILIFDNDGKYLNTIGKLGKGPEEYLNLQDAIINNEKVEMLVNSGNDFIYDYTYDGQLISRRKLDLPPVFSFEKDNEANNYYLSASHNPIAKGRIYEYNTNTEKVINTFLEPNKLLTTSSENTFYKSEKNEIYFWEALGNVVYQINKGGLNKVIHLEWGNDEDFNQISQDLFNKKMSTEVVYLIRNVIIKNEFSLISMVKFKPGNPPELLNILKKDERTYAFNITNNEYFGISQAQFIDKDNTLYFLLEAQNLKYKENQNYSNLSEYIFVLKIDVKEIIKLISKS